MPQQKLIDHLFRHQYGKMVSILIRIFGLTHLEMIEDVVQDTFVKAMLSWRDKIPENPEAWLTMAAKNRAIDLFRKLDAEKKRIPKLVSGSGAIALNDLFLDNEIADSQLRMIFTACHPILNPFDQISFSLKMISGFSTKEIAAALLHKEDRIKKRLSRARKTIREKNIAFDIPQGEELPIRLNRVLEVLYLIFNEGFHSNKKEMLIRENLCGEALRLTQILLKNKNTNNNKVYALFALMCFHSARLPGKINEAQEMVDLKNQDRSLWHIPLIELGNQAMNKAVEHGEYTSYHYEAAIAGEHVKAASFETTDWNAILRNYEKLYELQPSPFIQLNIAIVLLQKNDLDAGFLALKNIDDSKLEQRRYLYYSAVGEFYILKKEFTKAKQQLTKAISLVKNQVEMDFLKRKIAGLSDPN